jgi:hypothetical protein
MWPQPASQYGTGPAKSNCVIVSPIVPNGHARRRAKVGSPASVFGSGLEHDQQFFVQSFVSRDDMALGEHRVGAVEIGDEAA